jgi:DNA-binding beta-propeller fold protein YncE
MSRRVWRWMHGTATFGSGAEGIAYDRLGNRIFIADGEGTEIYQVLPVDGVFGNGNDQVSHFDSASVGVVDPETVEFNPVPARC